MLIRLKRHWYPPFRLGWQVWGFDGKYGWKWLTNALAKVKEGK
jgi:hypothetical protein